MTFFTKFMIHVKSLFLPNSWFVKLLGRFKPFKDFLLLTLPNLAKHPGPNQSLNDFQAWMISPAGLGTDFKPCKPFKFISYIGKKSHSTNSKFCQKNVF